MPNKLMSAAQGVGFDGVQGQYLRYLHVLRSCREFLKVCDIGLTETHTPDDSIQFIIIELEMWNLL